MASYTAIELHSEISQSHSVLSSSSNECKLTFLWVIIQILIGIVAKNDRL